MHLSYSNPLVSIILCSNTSPIFSQKAVVHPHSLKCLKMNCITWIECFFFLHWSIDLGNRASGIMVHEKNLVINLIFYLFFPHYKPHQWLSGSALELVDGRYRVQSSVALVDLAVRSRNSRKYGLWSLKKTPTEGTPPSQAQVPHADHWPYPYSPTNPSL